MKRVGGYAGVPRQPGGDGEARSTVAPATLVVSDDQPEGLAAPSQGNAQTTPDGGLFVGWGALPYFSEFDPSGRLVFNAEFPTGVNTSAPTFSPGVRASSARNTTPIGLGTDTQSGRGSRLATGPHASARDQTRAATVANAAATRHRSVHALDGRHRPSWGDY